eukprot:scaffold34556_cov129-Isochrysis_galbana.AAC.6
MRPRAASAVASRRILTSCMALPSATAGARAAAGSPPSSGRSISPTVPATRYAYSSSSATVSTRRDSTASERMPAIMSSNGWRPSDGCRSRHAASAASISSAGEPSHSASNRRCQSSRCACVPLGSPRAVGASTISSSRRHQAYSALASEAVAAGSRREA